MGPTRKVQLEWTGHGDAFRAVGVEPPSSQIVIDGDAIEGPSPMQVLLMAAGACSGIDIVMILQKMRVTIDQFSIDAIGERVEEHPRRYKSMKLIFKLRGDGIDRSKADRAAQLSVDKYCSVLRTLDPDMQLEYEVVLS